MGTENLTDLQLAVMKVLWNIGEGTVGDVLTATAQDGRVLAPTTVATLLQRLSRQGWVKHRKQGRQFLYRARVEQKQVATGALQNVLHAFFGGRVSALAAQLLESERLDPGELEQMRTLLKQKGS